MWKALALPTPYPHPSYPFWFPHYTGPGLARTPLEGLGHSQNALCSPFQALGVGGWRIMQSWDTGVYALVKWHNQGDQGGREGGSGAGLKPDLTADQCEG